MGKFDNERNLVCWLGQGQSKVKKEKEKRKKRSVQHSLEKRNENEGN